MSLFRNATIRGRRGVFLVPGDPAPGPPADVPPPEPPPPPEPVPAPGEAPGPLPSRLPPLSASLASVFFFLSGFSALVFEVIWMRRLHLVLGSTGFAVATVVAAYMGGLALGSWVGGKAADRMRYPLLVYGILELGVGLYALAVPSIFEASVPLYRWIYASTHLSFYPFSILRFLLAMIVLAVPTTFMGATLPLISRHMIKERKRIGSGVGLLYALNTLGAVAGSFAGGFLLLPNFGEWKSLILAAIGNFVIASGVILLALVRRKDLEAVPAPAKEGATPAAEESAGPRVEGPRAASAGPFETPTPATRPLVLVAFAVSGLASLSMQIAWTRLLALLLGSSVYAFSIILTTFLAGLALGSFVASRLVKRVRNPVAWLAVAQVLAAGLAVGGIFFYNRLFYAFLLLFNAHEIHQSIPLLFAGKFLMAAAVILPPTLCMGACFPLGVKAYARGLGGLGRRVGEIYSVNTLGSILGAFLGGFVLLPLLGLQNTVEFAAVLYLLSAAAVGASVRPTVPPLRWAGAACALVLVPVALLATPEPNPHILSMGIYKYAHRFYDEINTYARFLFYNSAYRRRVLFYREGITTTVTVFRSHTQTSIAVNGKVDGSSVGDLSTELLSGQLPLLFTGNPRKALVIGYGTGITAGTMALHEDLDVDLVELEPAVLEAGRYFRHVNHDTEALVQKGRIRLIKNDGRNLLLASRDRWDVIVSEPSNPWISGASKLFTLQFFERVRDRLESGGVFAQWVQLYGMDARNVRSLLATFRRVFGAACVFQLSPGADLLLVGRKGADLQIPRERLEALFGIPGVKEDLALLEVKDEADLAAYFLADDRALKAFLDAGDGALPLNTDDNAFIEFNAPKTFYYSGRADDIQKAIETHYRGPLETFSGWTGREAASFLARCGEKMVELRRPLASALATLSLEIEPTADGYALLARLLWTRQPENALHALERGLVENPRHRLSLFRLGALASGGEKTPAALAALERLLALRPHDHLARYRRGINAFLIARDLDEMLETCRASTDLPSPLLPLPALEALARAAAARAVSDLEAARASGLPLRRVPGLLRNLGLSRRLAGDLEGAIEALSDHVRWKPDDLPARKVLDEMLTGAGRLEEARKIRPPGQDRDQAESFWLVSKGLFKAGRKEKATTCAFLALEKASLSADMAWRVGNVLLHLHRPREAAEAWRRGLRFHPGHEDLAPSFAHVAEILAEKAGDPARRKGLYEEAAQALRERIRREKEPARRNEYAHRVQGLLRLARGK